VDRFGHGDLSVRTQSTRSDEFGDLARAFDVMAGHIERLVAEQQRLLQDVSHELRSPLARLGYAIELARVGDHREEALAQIQKDIDRLTILVNELLEVTRGDGESIAGLEDVSLGALVANIAADCELEFKARSCSTALVIGETIVVKAVPKLIRRAVENVLRNAVRHAPAGSLIDITVARTAAWSTIAIRDRGPGVPDDQLDMIFRPFFRVEDDRDRETGGVGLGLAIAQRAITQHRGHIRARNADPGLVILIELPA
jgi:signal transduction histidine kinase